MTPITQNHWTLHYTIGRILAAEVRSGDLVHMPGGRGDLIMLGGRPHDEPMIVAASPSATLSSKAAKALRRVLAH